MATVTEKEAFFAMYAFLVDRYERTKSNEIAAMLGELSFLPDGGTADPATWQD